MSLASVSPLAGSSPLAIDYEDCSIWCNSSLSSSTMSLSPSDVLNRLIPLVAFTSGLNKETESRIKGIRELLNLACSVNYNSKRTCSNSFAVSWYGLYPLMNLKVISWNVRGLNNARKTLSNLLKNWKLDIVF